jgi:hypothetical protein
MTIIRGAGSSATSSLIQSGIALVNQSILAQRGRRTSHSIRHWR